jgi:hypothetical protein
MAIEHGSFATGAIVEFELVVAPPGFCPVQPILVDVSAFHSRARC